MKMITKNSPIKVVLKLIVAMLLASFLACSHIPVKNPSWSKTANGWRGLVVAEENRCSPYRRKDYRYSQSLEKKIVNINLNGRIYSPYTGRFFYSTKETDIEHIVSLSEAHDSGLCAADAQTKRRFASDLRNLTLASPRLNRYEKKYHDAAEWIPKFNRCWFAKTVVLVKRAYGLTVDSNEARALEKILVRCPNFCVLLET